MSKRMQKGSILGLSIFGSLIASVPSYAQFYDYYDSNRYYQGRYLRPGEQVVCSVVQTSSLRFDSNDRAVLRDLLEDRPDLIGYDLWDLMEHQVGFNLPWGIQNQIVRGRTLPQGLLNRTVFLPASINSRLGLPTANNIRVGMIGNDAILYDMNTRMVLDVMLNVI